MDPNASKHLQAAGYSIASNISVQLLARGFTFFLRAITLKYLQSSALLGIIHIQLALLYTTLQFLSREPFRKACIGQLAKSKDKSFPKVVNTIWLGCALSLILAIPLAHIWKLNSPAEHDLSGTNVDDYYRAVLMTCLAVIIEMMAEPCFIYAQDKAIAKHNPKVDATSSTIKCLIACCFVIESAGYEPGRPTNILTKMAISQLIASTISVIYSYISLCQDQKLSIFVLIPSLNYPDKSTLRLSLSFISQTFLKQLLTEGERYVMTFFHVISLSEQGIYEVINNLGSLSARLIFKPIEDSGYTLFSQMVNRDEILDIRRFYRVQEYLMSLIKSMLLVGLVVLAFGYNFVPLIVLYGGEKLNTPLAFHLMRWQLFYTPILAVNGVTECFTFAIMSRKEIRNYNYQLVSYSLILIISIYFTRTYLGSACFMFANCLIMILRIISSHGIIRQYFQKHGYKINYQDALPSLTTLIILTGMYTFLSISQHYLLDMSQPISVMFGIILGTWCGFCFIFVVVPCHEEALLDFVSKLFKQKTK